MNGELVITVSQVGKAYRIWSEPTSRLISPMLESCARFLPAANWLKKEAASRYRDFQALEGVSFEVRRGEAIGIIGRNGSGKSTLLQIISGTLQPTQGSARVNGRIAALLELGSGFNPEFSGRENVYLNGAVLGLSRQQMDERFAAIADFADIGDFIEQPVRTYSSGMVVRLAFAVAAHVDPDILVVDEALSVGDARFQLKCARLIDLFIKRGVTLLFVSHDVSMIKRLCNRALLLEGGRVLYQGQPNDVVNLYSKLMADGGSAESLAADIRVLQHHADSKEPITTTATSQPPVPAVPPTAANDEIRRLQLQVKALEAVLNSHPGSPVLSQRLRDLWNSEREVVQARGNEFAYGGDLGCIHSVEVCDADGLPRTWCTTGETLMIRMVVESRDHLTEPIFALTIKNAAGVEIYGTNTLFGRQPSPAIAPGEHREVIFTLDFDVMPGHYFLSTGFTHFVGEKLVVIHRRYDVIQLDVHGLDQTFGIANLHAKITQRTLVAGPAA